MITNRIEIDEYDGGTIERECPNCGQYCKVPDHYKLYFNDAGYFMGAFAESYCKRCKKNISLKVIFIPKTQKWGSE